MSEADAQVQSTEILNAVGEVNKRLREEFSARLKEVEAGAAQHDDIEKVREGFQEVIGRIDSIEARVADAAESSKLDGEIMEQLLEATGKALSEELEAVKSGSTQTQATLEGFTQRLDETFASLEALSAFKSATEGTLDGALIRVNQVEEDAGETKAALDALGHDLASMRAKLQEQLKEMQQDDTLRTELDERIAETSKQASQEIDKLRDAVLAFEPAYEEKRLEIDAFKTAVSEQMDTLAQRVIGAHQKLKGWLRGDPGYQETALVRWKGGVWQALQQTTEEPSVSEHWVLVLDGVTEVASEPTGRPDGSAKQTVHLASGRTFDYETPGVAFTKGGTYAKGESYTQNTVVVKDGCSWLALKDTAEAPGSSDEWTLVGQRGARGKAGPKWTKEETARLMLPIAEGLVESEVEKQLFPAISGALNAGDGIPLLSFRGAWDQTVSYPRGHVITGGDAMFIASEAISAGIGPLQLGTSNPWVHMLSSGGGGGGAGGAGYKVGQANGIEISSSDNTINMVGTGDTTVSAVTSGGTTTWTINSVTGGAGGGITSGLPFVVGELMEVSSDVGAGQAVSSGVTAAEINGHIADTDIHFSDAPVDGVIYGRVDNGWSPAETSVTRSDGGGVSVVKGEEGNVLPFRSFENSQFEFLGDLINVQSDAFEVTGAVADHVAQPDPHPQYLGDAPSNNDVYGRLNGAWTPVTGFPGFAYTWNSSTNTTSDPGNGAITVNSAVFAAVTEIAIDDLTRGGYNLRSWVQGVRIGTQIRIATEYNVTISGVYEVAADPISVSGYIRIPVTYLSDGGGGFPINNDPVRLLMALGGAENLQVGGDVEGPAGATDNNFALYDGATGKLIKDTGVSAASFDAAGTAATVQGNLDTHEALTDNPHQTSHGDLLNLTADDHPQYHTDARGDARYGQLTAVNDWLAAQRFGTAGIIVQPDASSTAFGYAPDGIYTAEDGAVELREGIVELHGSQCKIDALQFAPTGNELGQIVHVSEDGVLFGVDAGAPGWEITATDSTNTNLGTGDTTGPWFQLGFAPPLAVPQDVAPGEVIHIQVSIHWVNLSGFGGNVDVGIGIDGAQPTAPGDTVSIGGGFTGYIAESFVDASLTLMAGQTLEVWARINSGVTAAFAPIAEGLTNNHTAYIYLEAAGGGAGEANTSSNVGGFAALALTKVGVDLPFRTLQSSDASVTITVNADNLDLQATGAGGGESNTQTNQGGGLELGLTKNGVDLPLRTFATDAFIGITQNINTLDFALSPIDATKLQSDSVTTAAIVDANVTLSKMAPDSVSTTQIIDGNVTASKMAANSIATVNIIDAQVTRAKEANMAANTVRLRAATAGVPTDTEIEALPDGGTPAPADHVLGQKDSGDLVKFAGASFTYTFDTSNTWTLPGNYDSSTNVLEWKVSAAPNQTVVLDRVQYKTITGTSVVITVNQNGGAIPGYSGLPVTSAWATTSAPAVLADDDELDLIINAGTSGVGLSVTVVLRHLVTLS